VDRAPSPEPVTTRPPRQAAIAFVCIAMLIDTISFGLLIPVMPQFLAEVTGQSISDATRIAGLLVVTFAALQFLCGPLIGALSDRFGRRPILLASMAAFAVNYTVMGLAESVAVLFAARALTGIAGATYAPCNAYVADITPPEQRAQRFALVGAAFGVGFILGPALGALLGQLGPRAPFFVAAAMAGVNLLFGLFVLPESLPPERRRKIEWRRANPVGALAALRQNRNVLGIVACIFLYSFAFQVYPTTWSFFAAIKFDWGPAAMGLALAYSGLLMALAQGTLTGRIARAIGERRAGMLGMMSAASGMLWNAFCTAGWQLYIGATLGALQGLSSAAMNAIATSRTAPDRQGELQGAISSLNGIGMIVSPFILSQTLATFTGPAAPVHFPGAAFVLSGVLTLCAMGLLAWSLREKKGAAPAAA
jgi:DHA1 family tetracycline resistance protein-like MFS transporter